jgi:hypothetical protein
MSLMNSARFSVSEKYVELYEWKQIWLKTLQIIWSVWLADVMHEGESFFPLVLIFIAARLVIQL